MAETSQSVEFPKIPVLRRLVVLFLFVLFFNLFFFHQWGAVSFILQTLGFFLFLLGIFLDKVHSHRKTLAGFALFFLLTCSIVLIRSNPFITIVYSLATIASFGLLTYLLATNIPFFRSLLELVLSPLFLLFSYIGSGLQTVGWFLSGRILELFGEGRGEKKALARLKPLIIGLVLGVPIAVILISMFSGADPIFASTIKKIFDLKFLNNIPARIVLSVLLFLFLSPFIFLKRNKEFRSPIHTLEEMHLVHEMTVVMTLVGLVLASFLVIQWPYVFASVPFETDLSKFGVSTYSEYVKRGFIELMQIAAFIYGLIWAGLVFLRGKKEGQKTLLPLMQGIVLTLFFVFLLSIFRRIWLYQAHHGWSLVRIYGGFFLVWLTGISATLAARHMWRKQWVTIEVGMTIILFLILGTFNAEDFIVKNHPPTVNKRIDHIYLSNMSPDGYSGWQKALQYGEDVLTKRNYQDKALINREERREVAYAGIILTQLTRNYHVLLTDFGSTDEIRLYYKTILIHEKEANESVKQILDGYKRSYELQSTGPFEKPVPAPSLPIQQHEVLSQLQYAQERRRKIDELLKNIEDTKSNLSSIAQDIFIGHPFPIISFYLGNLYPSLFEVKTFTPKGSFLPSMPPPETLRIQTSLDRFFVWNKAKVDALNKMQQDMPLEKLLALQKAYFSLFQKIALQSENERDYDTDISFSTPFLFPL